MHVININKHINQITIVCFCIRHYGRLASFLFIEKKIRQALGSVHNFVQSLERSQVCLDFLNGFYNCYRPAALFSSQENALLYSAQKNTLFISPQRKLIRQKAQTSENIKLILDKKSVYFSSASAGTTRTKQFYQKHKNIKCTSSMLSTQVPGDIISQIASE